MRSELRSFVLAKARGARPPQELTDQTPLLADGWLRSVHLPELLLLMERLRGTPIDVENLKAGDFRDIDTLMDRFGHAPAQHTAPAQNPAPAQHTAP
jgi:hypothetical protein